jgi:hypothetical protein
MKHGVHLVLAATAASLLLSMVPKDALADRYEVRREVREGYYEVERTKRQAERNVRRCTTRECAQREIREGYRDVELEKREARREVRRELREDRYRDQYYRGDDRWYRDGRYWDRSDYERRYYRNRDRDENDFLKGAVVGAAAVGIAVAIAKSNDD